MEDGLKLLKVEYLSNHLLDHAQIWNLCLYDQTIFYKSLKQRRPQNIKKGISPQPLIESYSYLKLKLRWPNHILQILKMKTTSNGRQPQVERCPQSVQNVTYEF